MDYATHVSSPLMIAETLLGATHMEVSVIVEDDGSKHGTAGLTDAKAPPKQSAASSSGDAFCQAHILLENDQPVDGDSSQHVHSPKAVDFPASRCNDEFEQPYNLKPDVLEEVNTGVVVSPKETDASVSIEYPTSIEFIKIDTQIRIVSRKIGWIATVPALLLPLANRRY